MQVFQTSFEAIGTQWHVSVYGPIDALNWHKLVTQIHDRIEQFDRHYSRFREDSWVMQIARQAGVHELPPDGFRLLVLYEQLYIATGGKVTPLIGQTMVDAGYDANYSLQPKQLVSPPRWEDVLTYDKQRITVKQAVLLDFGAAGKGYLVDLVSDIVQAAGATAYLINAGGDMVHRSTSGEMLEVGLENPFDTTEVVGIAKLGNRSLCASAGSKRSWGEFHHVIDPDELKSPESVVATWVMADDTMTADGLASALFFVPPARLKTMADFEYAVLGADHRLSRSPQFEAELFGAAT